MKPHKIIFLTINFFLLIIFSSCVKKSDSKETSISETTASNLNPYEKTLMDEKEAKLFRNMNQQLAYKQKKFAKIKKSELDFVVQNITGKTIWVTCFSYIEKYPFTRWRWDKSSVYKLQNKESTIIDIDYIPDEQNRKNVYGYLAVFNSKKDALNATYELLDDKQKLDLDNLINLKNQKVLIGVEKYGFKGSILDLNLISFNKYNKTPELDFLVENKMGKTVYITCFVYEKKNDMPVWQYDKTEVKKIKPGESVLINVDTISNIYNRVYMRGTLGIFDEDQKKEALNSTYELLEPKNKISLGRLLFLRGKKVVLNIEKYGILGSFNEFALK